MTMELSAPVRGTGADAAAAAARRVIAGLVRAGDISGADLDGVTDRLNAIADELDATAPDLEERMVDMWHGEGNTRHDAVAGTENPLAPPLDYAPGPDGSIQAEVVLDLPYQGPPGCVHGGVSALILDHTLGVANGWAGVSGMTAELTLRYHHVTPLFEPLTVTARQVSVDGVKIRTVGSISAGGRECVTAEGLFIAKHRPRPR